MSITYRQFIALACQEALAGQNSIKSPILDIEFTAETLVPEVFQAVALSYAADPQKASLLSRDNTIALTNGAGTLPDAVLSTCKFNGTVSVPSDDTIGPKMSLVRTWLDFISPSSTDRLMGRWTIKDSGFYWIDPGDAYSSTSGRTGNITFNVPSVPAIPATEGATLVVHDEVQSDLISSLAQRLRGVLEKAA